MDAPARPAKQITWIELPATPEWVGELLDGAAPQKVEIRCDPWEIRSSASCDFALFRASLRDVPRLDHASLRAAVERLYGSIGPQLRDAGRYPLRFWNYLPEICRRPGGGLSRYEVFNAGRFAGYEGWLRSGDFEKWMATASAVGHRGDDLVVDILAGRWPATPVENPRQRPAYRYSRRYGPVPPCFSRAVSLEGATRTELAPRALVAGTASVIGEDSRHPGDVDAQLREVLRNLACVSAAIAAEPSPTSAGVDAEAFARGLSRYRELRAYVANEAKADRVIAEIDRAFPHVERVEIARAEMCRPELVIEIEGVVSSTR